jgi:predicted Zn finger-like uncharacterized protein
MPFIAQCPYPSCRKYLLLEDAVRGETMACLLCKQPIQISRSKPGEPPTVSMAGPPNAALVSSAPPKRRYACPQCGAALMAPAAGAAGLKVRCGKCGHVFVAD